MPKTSEFQNDPESSTWYFSPMAPERASGAEVLGVGLGGQQEQRREQDDE